MDAFLGPDLPWQLRAAAWLGCGLVVAFLILIIPKSLLARTGQMRLLSPNAITLWRAVLFWGGAWLFFHGSPFAGFLVVVIASILDVTDGRTATALRERNIPRSQEDQKLGEWLDPLVDKLTILPMIGLFAAKGIINVWIAVINIAIDVIGTLMRDPFILDIRIRRFLRPAEAIVSSRTTKANGAGKYKALLHALSLVPCGAIYLSWTKNVLDAPNVMLGVALVLALVSLLSRLRASERLSVLVSRFDRFFSHRDL